MPFNLRPAFWPVNAAPSSYAIIAAQSAGGGDTRGLVHGFLRACWAEKPNISQGDTIRTRLSAAGLDPGLADRGSLARAETYPANTEEVIARGVFGAPFYIVDGSDQRSGVMIVSPISNPA